MQNVELTAWRNGLLNELLLVLSSDGRWDEAAARIDSKLDEAKGSFSRRGGQLTIDFGTRSVSLTDLANLVDHIKQEFGLLPVAVVTTDPVTQEAARALVLSTYQMLPGASLTSGSGDAATGNNALYVGSTVRSGQRLLHSGHIIVGGDVNSGGEVIAVGDIVVFGTLRGLAHAGSQGDESARIIAGTMRPQQIRIAGKIARSPEDASGARVRYPEVARIENGEIQVSPI